MLEKLFFFLRKRRDLNLLHKNFDYVFYREQSSDISTFTNDQLLEHYLFFGWREGRDPSPYFSSSGYLETYPDVAAANLNPFLHYLRHGHEEKRECPEKSSLNNLEEWVSKHFDFDYYRSNNPDIAHFDDRGLVKHFHNFGWKEGRNPTSWFSVEKYLAFHSDVAATGQNPFFHYIAIGEKEGRKIARPLPCALEYMTEAQIKLVEAEFDPDYYRKYFDDQDGSSRDLLAHYIDTGWKQNLNPCAEFSTQFYLETYNPPHNICPLVHFLLVDPPQARCVHPDKPIRLPLCSGEAMLPSHLLSVIERANPESEVAPPALVQPERGLDLHWVIPDFSKGAGGHMTIFRMIRFLELFGHRSTIWIERPVFHHDCTSAYETIVKYFQCVEAEVRFIQDGFYDVSADAAIATGWSTAYHVNAAKGFAVKYYFVQDHEPDFYPVGTESLLARETYDFDLACICASPWLEQIMRARYNRWAQGFHLAYDENIYCNVRGNPNFEYSLTGPGKPFKIAVYAREHTARRCVQLAFMGLEILGRNRSDFEVHFFGQKDISFQEAGFTAYNHGILDEKSLAQLYSECDLGICFSATNYSLVPQEMMSCGLPVAELDGESTRAIFPVGVVALVGPDPVGIGNEISELIDAPERLDQQRKAALDWVGNFTWESSARAVETALLDYLKEAKKIHSIPTVQRPRDVVLDVVIPTYNGLGEVEPVIEALRGQYIAENIQIHCIDSSSSDGTTAWLQSQSDINTIVIPQEEFQHGRSRNIAAAQGNAPFIAYLTQDALPADMHWGSDIVKMLRHHPKAAGLFGRHLPYPDHCLRVRQDITRHFQNMLQHPLALSRDTNPVRWQNGDIAWRQLLHFYSDNNSAMRRSVWKKIPYPEVDYGEDQVWANTIIEAGHTKLYAPTAVVYHSHDFSPEETYKRCHIEAAFFYTHFGYKLGKDSREELEGHIAREQKQLETWALKYQVLPEELLRQQAIATEKFRGWHDGQLTAMAHDPNVEVVPENRTII